MKKGKNKKRSSYIIRTIISDLKGTQYAMENYLKEKKIDLKYQDEIQEKVNQEIDQCEVCDTWDELGEMTQGHCEHCWKEAPENPEYHKEDNEENEEEF